jgi:hypothetical protein
MLEPRINILTEQAGLIIGSEEEHLAFLRKTSFSVLNDIVSTTPCSTRFRRT